jgi:hypothetical protein
VKQIKSQIGTERQKIDAAEQEFFKIVPPPPAPSSPANATGGFTVPVDSTRFQLQGASPPK